MTPEVATDILARLEVDRLNLCRACGARERSVFVRIGIEEFPVCGMCGGILAEASIRCREAAAAAFAERWGQDGAERSDQG